MRKSSRLWKVLPAAACALALAACGKSQTQQSYDLPGDGTKIDVKKIDAGATALRLADGAYAKGDFNMAAQLYFRAAELQPDKSAVMVKLGFALFKTGGAADAEKIFRVALEKEPKNADALRGLAHSLVTQGRAAESLPIYRQAIAAAGTPDSRIYAGLGAALDMVGKHEEARTAYAAGLKLAPKDFGLRNNLAISYAMSGDTAKAQSILAGLTEEGGAAPKAAERLSALKSTVASTRPAPAKKRQVAEAAPAKPVAPQAAQPPAAQPKIAARSEPGEGDRDVAEVPAPVAAPAPARVTRKATADLADAGDGEIFIQTGRATLAKAEKPRTPAMSFRSSADTPEDTADEVIALLAQAERGPRFVWQLARRPDPS
jgi:Flp pilus assembly protein TadD